MDGCGNVAFTETIAFFFSLHQGAKPATGSPAAATAAACGSVKSKAVMVLNKLRVSVELLIALAALLCWLTVGVVMFDFVEYKAVPGGFSIIIHNSSCE